jgi:hypothetical protein
MLSVRMIACFSLIVEFTMNAKKKGDTCIAPETSSPSPEDNQLRTQNARENAKIRRHRSMDMRVSAVARLQIAKAFLPW